MKRKAFKAAFPYTLPILAGFSFLGMASWNLHECIRVFFCLPSLHEFSDLRWLFGVCRCRELEKNMETEYVPVHRCRNDKLYAVTAFFVTLFFIS